MSDAEGKDRHARKWGFTAKPGPMVKIPESRFALLLKLIDRLANSKASRAANAKLPLHRQKGKFGLYQREQSQFYEALHVRDTPAQPLWGVLNEMLDYTPPSLD